MKLISPDLSISDTSLEDLLKQSSYTVLYFYPKNNTPGCTVEAKDFSALMPEFTRLDTQVIGVSKDEPKSHCSFIEKYDLTPLYLSDPELELHKQFDTRKEKSMYGKTFFGGIRSTFVLDQSGTIIQEWRKVKTKGHAQAVLDRCTEQK